MNSSIFNSELITELLPNAIQKSLDDYSHLGILNTDLIVAPFFMVALAVVLMVYIKKKPLALSSASLSISVHCNRPLTALE